MGSDDCSYVGAVELEIEWIMELFLYKYSDLVSSDSIVLMDANYYLLVF